MSKLCWVHLLLDESNAYSTPLAALQYISQEEMRKRGPVLWHNRLKLGLGLSLSSCRTLSCLHCTVSAIVYSPPPIVPVDKNSCNPQAEIVLMGGDQALSPWRKQKDHTLIGQRSNRDRHKLVQSAHQHPTYIQVSGFTLVCYTYNINVFYGVVFRGTVTFGQWKRQNRAGLLSFISRWWGTFSTLLQYQLHCNLSIQNIM